MQTIEPQRIGDHVVRTDQVDEFYFTRLYYSPEGDMAIEMESFCSTALDAVKNILRVMETLHRDSPCQCGTEDDGADDGGDYTVHGGRCPRWLTGWVREKLAELKPKTEPA